MTFASIILKNMVKRMQNYVAYFFSTSFCVIVYHLFCTMYYNPAFSVYRFGKGKMNTLFQYSAAAVLVFATIFVLYSGNYFIRGRKKEIAVYSLLGMRKKQIAVMLFAETFLIGVLAAGFGILVSSAVCGLLFSALMRFMAIGTSVTLVLSNQAVIATIVSFTLLFVVNGINAYRIIYQFSLNDLLNATKQREQLPTYSIPAALISLLMLGAGYLISVKMNLNSTGIKLLFPAFLVVAIIAAGTWMLFRNAVPMFISLLKKSRRIYYKTADFICISQVSFRLKNNARMLAVVSILCAIAITMVSASYSLYRGLEEGTRFYATFSYLVKDISPRQQEEILQLIDDKNEVRVKAQDEIRLLKVDVQNDHYAIQTGTQLDGIRGKQVQGYLMSEQTYCKVLQDTGTRAKGESNLHSGFTGGLKENQCFFLDGNMTDHYSSELAGEQLSLQFKDEESIYQITGTGIHKYLGLLDLYQTPTIIVADSVFQEYLAKAGKDDMLYFFGLIFDDDMMSGNTVDALDELIPPRFHHSGLPGNISYIGLYKANFALYGSYVFIGFFLGILFLLSLSSVMYYKMIMEAQEEKNRYEILRKVGMKKKEIQGAVAKQIGIYFGAPLALGLIHTVFALLTYNRMLEQIGQETPSFQNALMVAGGAVILYGGFYLLSVSKYMEIISKK